VSAGPDAGFSQLLPTVSDFEPETVQPRPWLALQSANLGTYPHPYLHAPVPAASSLPRRHSETNVDHWKNWKNLGPPVSVNQLRYSSIPEYPVSPLPTSSAQYPVAGPTDTIQETSPYTQDDPAAYGHSYPLSSSSELPDDSASVTSFDESASPGPSDGTDHVLQKGTASGSQQKRRRTVNRKRAAEPKDSKAADRLRNQREEDDRFAEATFDLIVPSGVKKGPKKDRQRTSTFNHCGFP